MTATQWTVSAFSVRNLKLQPRETKYERKYREKRRERERELERDILCVFVCVLRDIEQIKLKDGTRL